MPRVFISYRREDTAYPASWLFDRLGARFGEDNVFKDVDSIDPGDDFVERITGAVGSCDVLLALIGEEWLTVADEDGRRRIDNPDDFVRVEIEAALARNVRVVPVLVDGASMPEAADLPPSLAAFARRQALELSPNRFDFDTNRLLDALGGNTEEEEKPPARRRTSIAVLTAGGAAAALVALAAVVILVFRGGDGAMESSSATAVTEDWTAQANEVCERANEAIDDLPEASAANLETLGAEALVGYGVAALNVNKRMVRDLRELSPPPELRDDANELVLRGAKMTEAAEELFAALRVGDIAGVQRQQTALSSAGEAFDAKALELGATTCAEGASLSGTSLVP